MPNRYQTKERMWIYRFLVERDGKNCIHCGKSGVALEIDHADRDKSNHDPSNLHLLCKKCNNYFRTLLVNDQIKTIQIDCAKREREREKIIGNVSTHLLKYVVDYNTGSTEMQVNALCEVNFRRWLLEEIDRQNEITVKDAVNGGAEIVGCSPITTTRYVEKLTSPYGILATDKNAFGQKVLRRRDNASLKVNEKYEYKGNRKGK